MKKKSTSASKKPVKAAKKVVKPVKAAASSKNTAKKVVKKAAPAKKTAVAKKSVVAKKAAPKKASPAKKAVAKPVKKAAPKKAAPAKKVVKKAAPAKKVTPKAAAKKVVAVKKVAKKAATSKKAAPAKKVVAKKPVAKAAVKKVAPKAAPKKAIAVKKPIAKPAAKPVAKKTVPSPKAVTKKQDAPKPQVVEKPIEKIYVDVKDVAVKKPNPVQSPLAPKPDPKAKSTGPEKTRYSDMELMEFKDIIQKKLNSAREELRLLTETLSNPNGNGTDDTAGTFKVLEDGSATLEKEHINQLAVRQRKFIDQLDAALVRIENKTYGICRETGKLIQKERLRAVPHTTLSMEAKLKQN
jgi:RNA polymerase-binding transcription factor DksA